MENKYILLHNVFECKNEYVFKKRTEDEKEQLYMLHKYAESPDNGSPIVSFDKFIKKWKLFTKNALDGMEWDNIFCAGGSIVSCLSSSNMIDGNDIDLFLYDIKDKNHAENIINKIYNTIFENLRDDERNIKILKTSKAITIILPWPFKSIQIILRWFKSPAEIILGFDVDSCCVGFDGKNVYASDRFKRAMTKRYNLFNKTRISPIYEKRIYKYALRGFSLIIPLKDKKKYCKIVKKLTKNKEFDYFSFKPYFLNTRDEVLSLIKLIWYDNLLKINIPVKWNIFDIEPSKNINKHFSYIRNMKKEQKYNILKTILNIDRKRLNFFNGNLYSSYHYCQYSYKSDNSEEDTKDISSDFKNEIKKLEWETRVLYFNDKENKRKLMTGSFDLPQE